MIFPAITAFYAGLLALIYAILSSWVIAGRFSTGILHGAGESETLLRRARAHGNFSEYVPFILLLVALVESGGGAVGRVRILLIALTVARLAHPIGMMAPVNSIQQYVCRGLAVVVTLIVMVVAAVLLLLRVAHA